MTKTEALALLESGKELTLSQRVRIKEVLEKAEVYGDSVWNESGDEWYDSSWGESTC